MSASFIPAAIILLYILLLYAVSWWTRGLGAGGGTIRYFLAGRGLPAWVVAAMLAGLAVGGASTVGVAQRAYGSGISAGWYNAAWAAGAFVTGLLAAARYRRAEVGTLPELLDRHYGTGGRVLGVFGQLVIHIVITSLQYVAGGAVLSSLLPGLLSLQTGMLVTAVVFVGITLIGGLWAASVTNILNVILIYVGICLAAVLGLRGALAQVGGLGNLADYLHALPTPNPGFDPGGLGFPLILAWFLIMIPTALGTQAVAQISFAAKDPASARRGFLIGGLFILPVGFVSALIGIAAAVLHPGLENSAEALPRTVLGLNPFLAGLVLAGLWAADVSTACGLLLASATLLVGDIVKRFVPDLGERREYWMSRGAVLAISVVTFLMGLFVAQDILKALLTGLTLNTAYALVTLMTLFAPGLCRKGSALWTLAVTMLSLATWFILPGSWRGLLVHPIYFVLPACVLSFFLVALFDKRPMSR